MDLLYSLANLIVEFMESAPAWPLGLLYPFIAAIPAVLVHELGHAVVAQRRLGADVDISVGSAGKLAQLRLGQITASIHALSHPGRAAGSASFDGSAARAVDVVWIAVAGPLASLAGVLVTALLFAAAPETGLVHDLLWGALLAGVLGVLNLIPFAFQERRAGPSLRSDGRLALDALAVVRAVR